MQDEVRLPVQGVDLIHGGLEGSADIGIGCLVEPDVTVADLYKSEVLGACLSSTQQGSAQQAGRRYTPRKAPYHPRSTPLHTFQETAAVHARAEDPRSPFPVVVNS